MKKFPILIDHEGTQGPCPSWIFWEDIAPYEGQARENHGQTLERLAERGGLSPVEAFFVMTGRRWKGETFSKELEIEACNFLDMRVRYGQIQKLCQEVDELQLAVGRAEGQLREVMKTSLHAPEAAAHIKAAFDTLERASNGIRQNPVCQCGESLSRHGGCRNFREKAV